VTPTQKTKQFALDCGFDNVGVCHAFPVEEALAFYEKWLQAGNHAEMEYLSRHSEVKQSPQSLLDGAKSIIAVTLNYYQPMPTDQPKIARYALGRDYHKVLRSKLKTLARNLGKIYPDAQFRACVDSAPVLERTYASLAGLGWFGKNTMLIDSKRGSWFFIGLLLTTLELEPDPPSVGGCGTCRACIDTCPTGAIIPFEGRWAVKSEQCISYQTIEKRGELTVDTNGWLYGCDVCQEVCPFNTVRDSQPEPNQTF
jgi:epoxyqueuosine reductase